MTQPFPIARALVAATVALSVLGPAAAQDAPALRGDVTVTDDTLTLGDLVAGAPGGASRTALFRAPALGASGTIQVRRILDAAAAEGIGSVETGGRAQIVVTRAARHVGTPEIESALRAALAAGANLDPRGTGIVFDGDPPALVVAPGNADPVAIADLSFDRRTRRVSALAWIGPSPNERRASVRVTGSAVDFVDVTVLTRALARGDAVKSADLAVERRPREGVPADFIAESGPLPGQVARRAVAAGSVVRTGDLARPELVGRGDIVSVVYESPGMMLTMRAKAMEAGALGDTVGITNPQSKKVLQATVSGPGKVTVGPAPPGRVAAAGMPPGATP